MGRGTSLSNMSNLAPPRVRLGILIAHSIPKKGRRRRGKKTEKKKKKERKIERNRRRGGGEEV
tara:strand:+ start:1133 stop:1321 length:189 start_codon:yes stop_codon:yes gene_type:complete